MKIWEKSGNGNWYGRGNGHKAVIYTHVDTDEVTLRVYDTSDFLAEVSTKKDITAAKRHAEKYYLKGRK